ncbi:T9SS type A sorting domain-containing protein [bacterium]|nr:T9SS type A sorting domain-containing protein [bacterium]
MVRMMGLLVCLPLLTISLSTEAWTQQSGTIPFGDSITIKWTSPGSIGAGTPIRVTLGITSIAEITLTYIGPEEPKPPPMTLLSDFSGGEVYWLIEFDSLGLPAGQYELKEKFSGIVEEEFFGIIDPPLVLSAEFDSWEAYIPAGATIIIKFTASGSFSVSGDFTGETGNLDPLPEFIWNFLIILQKDVEPGDIIEFDFSLDGTLTKTTEIIYTPGDVSGNGEVTAYDASLVLQYVVGLTDLSVEQQLAADVTDDDTITALDAALILQYTVGLITQFPVQGAPILTTKNENQILTKIIAELENISLTTELKHVLEQLECLILQQSLQGYTALLQNYPNPFNPETWLPYQLAQDTNVTISIYNLKGQPVRTLFLDNQSTGVYVMKHKAAYWDGRNSFGQQVASGLYFYTLQAGKFRATRKMVILK